jgi:hypothetical protein
VQVYATTPGLGLGTELGSAEQQVHNHVRAGSDATTRARAQAGGASLLLLSSKPCFYCRPICENEPGQATLNRACPIMLQRPYRVLWLTDGAEAFVQRHLRRAPVALCVLLCIGSQKVLACLRSPHLSSLHGRWYNTDTSSKRKNVKKVMCLDSYFNLTCYPNPNPEAAGGAPPPPTCYPDPNPEAAEVPPQPPATLTLTLFLHCRRGTLTLFSAIL